MHDQLEAIEPGSFQGFLRYLDEGHRHYQQAMQHLVNRDSRSAGEFFNPRNLPLLFTLHPFSQHYRHMAAYFHEPRLKAAFTFQDVHMGLSPLRLQRPLSMMPYTELAHGVWYPKGGMYRVVEALMEIARQAGVTFAFKTAVQQIEVHGNRATGVILEDGQHVQADAVLANADLPYIYDALLPPDTQAEHLSHKRYSCSVISFFWGRSPATRSLGHYAVSS